MDDDTGICDLCGAPSVRECLATEQFAYGANSDKAILSAEVLVFECGSCGEAYTGEHGEIARDEAVRRHLLSAAMTHSDAEL